MTVIVGAVILAACGIWELYRRVKARRAETEALLVDMFDDAEPFDIVEEAFEDYQRSIADLLDAHPNRSEDLIRGLEAATATWERTEFDILTRRLRTDLRFRLRLWAATHLTRTP